MKQHLAIAALLAVAAPVAVTAHGGESHPKSTAEKPARPLDLGKSQPGVDPAEAYFTNLEVVDQDGKPHRFYDDLVKGKKVVINFAFASCTDACSPITQNLAKVQKKLGASVGKDVSMLTITVDPANDTPAVLKRYAAKNGAKPGWYFLTGTRQNVNAILRKLGGYAEDPKEHSTVLIIGDASTGTWVKTFAMNKPETIAETVQKINAPASSLRPPT